MNRYKNLARQDMKDTRPSVWLTSLLYLCIITALSLLIYNLSGTAAYEKNVASFMEKVTALNITSQEELISMLETSIDSMIPEITRFAAIMTVVLTVVLVFVRAGFSGYCLLVSRKQATTPKDLLICFEHPLKLFILLLIQYVLIGVGFLLFLVPGVVLALCYSQAVFIHYEHPDYSPIQCLQESRQLVRGRKMMLLSLILSFILWWIGDQLVSGLIRIPLLQLYLAPFYGLTMAHFHLALVSGEAEEAPARPQGPNDPPQNRAV